MVCVVSSGDAIMMPQLACTMHTNLYEKSIAASERT